MLDRATLVVAPHHLDRAVHWCHAGGAFLLQTRTRAIYDSFKCALRVKIRLQMLSTWPNCYGAMKR